MDDKRQTILTTENAPNCYHVFTNCDHLLILETFERIKNNFDIYHGLSNFDIDKVDTLILPALIKDNLIRVTQKNKYEALVQGLLFDSAKEKLIFVQNHPKFVKNICDKINEENKNKLTFFEYVAKNVPVKEYNEILDEIKKIKNKILNLNENASGDTINCEFALLTHFDNN